MPRWRITRYIRRALHNAVTAATGGALLAMAMVYLFLGNLRRTLIIGSAIPIAVLVTFILMAAFRLTFNIMTLGGLALGIGMLVDSTHRHARKPLPPPTPGGIPSAGRGCGEPGGDGGHRRRHLHQPDGGATLPVHRRPDIGLLCHEFIFTISAAILASLLVPALAAMSRCARRARCGG